MPGITGKTIMETTKSSPVLQSETSKGNAKYWQCHITHENNHWFTQTSWWQQTKDGPSAIQFSVPYEAKPKNVGKKNESSAQHQAESEFDSIVQKQRDKGYHEEGTATVRLLAPMLAQKFNERKHKLVYPVSVQPKYNGQRHLYNGSTAWSRGGKLVIPQVYEHLQFDTQGNTVDGELILPGNVPLQETRKAAAKFRPGVSYTLKYFIYDLVDENIGFRQRYDRLLALFNDKDIKIPENVILAPTYLASDEVEIMKYHKAFKALGYEGIIVRNDGEGYHVGHRSNQLQKYKEFVDCEFRIVDVRSGEGSFEGCAIFILVNEEGLKFECNPEGTMEHKKELYSQKEKLIGKWLTVRYQERSNDNIPIFPVGTDIRDKEEANED